ncbi:MAG TPA: hypothetical protein VGI54_12470 [Solirubrobacteraceae bacterium]|jgi:hypothetical protein
MTRVRYMLPALYAIAIAVGFIISPTVGVAVAVIGGMLFGLLWSNMRAPRPGRGRTRRA